MAPSPLSLSSAAVLRRGKGFDSLESDLVLVPGRMFTSYRRVPTLNGHGAEHLHLRCPKGTSAAQVSTPSPF
jgi:hypothetical protein